MKRLIILAVAMLALVQAEAQEIKAVLVQLSTEENRIHYLKNSNHLLEAATVADDAAKARGVEQLDFTDNFDYCPVYYFMDTNRVEIKSGHFSGRLFDSKGLPVTDKAIRAMGNNFMVAYYGYQGDNKSAAPDHKSLILLDKDLNPFDVVFISQLRAPSDNDAGAKYIFDAPKYDIGYYPHATKLNEHMSQVAHKLEKHYKHQG